MEKINNVVDFNQLKDFNEEDGELNKFFDDVKGDVLKAAYFARTKEGKYIFGCTEENKVSQERMLYHLRNVIQFYVENYPDMEQIEETANILKIDKDQLIEDLFEDD